MSFSLLPECRVLPVMTTGSVESTLHLAAALQRGGMRALEITLRSDTALDCIRVLRRELPELMIAAGTVLNPADVERALEAGAQMLVSPGSTPELLRASRANGAYLLPGVASASEVMQGLDAGLTHFKLFPAEAVGGMALLKSLAGPFPDIRFCPTGGLGPANFRDYLALPNVICCGGSWMVAADLVDNERWDDIEALAAEAMS